jgi:metal-responsive CopG/Arc/MetJ family transcriptional regulator
MEHPKAKLSITLDPELVRAVDRAAKDRPGANRSSIIEAWLRRAVRMDLEDRLRADTIAYYERLSPREKKDDAAVARSSARAARRLELDEE